MELPEPEEDKVERYIGDLVRKKVKIACAKEFCGRKIPKSSCARKKTVYIYILITSRNIYRKITQPIRINSGPPPRRKCNKLIQFR